MGSKEMFAKIGLVSIIFMLFLVIINDQGNIWATLSTVDVTLANSQSLELLWTGLVAATLLQGFVVFAALLGANLLFTPVKETHGDDN